MRIAKCLPACCVILAIFLTGIVYVCSEEASAEKSYQTNGFLITEKEGKYGILAADGSIVLPFEYYIPLDQFIPGEEPLCIEVFQFTEAEYSGVYDLTRDLDVGRAKTGFIHLGSGYFSGCVWSRWISLSDQYAAVCNDENRWALLNAETGEIVLDYLYDFVSPDVSENWVYVWLWPTEYSERMGDWIRESAYVSLEDGRILTAPEGYSFAEWNEPIANGYVLVLEEGTGNESLMRVDDLLSAGSAP